MVCHNPQGFRFCPQINWKWWECGYGAGQGDICWKRWQRKCSSCATKTCLRYSIHPVIQEEKYCCQTVRSDPIGHDNSTFTEPLKTLFTMWRQSILSVSVHKPRFQSIGVDSSCQRVQQRAHYCIVDQNYGHNYSSSH